jgi:hypothetical protein
MKAHDLDEAKTLLVRLKRIREGMAVLGQVTSPPMTVTIGNDYSMYGTLKFDIPNDHPVFAAIMSYLRHNNENCMEQCRADLAEIGVVE